VEQANVWRNSLKGASVDDAWKALERTFAKHGHFKTPSPVNFCEQLNLLVTPAQGVHEPDDGARESPLYLVQTLSRDKRAIGDAPRRQTWAYPGHLPDEATMMRHAEQMHHEVARTYDGEWQIRDTRMDAEREKKRLDTAPVL